MDKCTGRTSVTSDSLFALSKNLIDFFQYEQCVKQCARFLLHFMKLALLLLRRKFARKTSQNKRKIVFHDNHGQL